MLILFVILIIIASFILGAIVLIQNPKGGGLTGSFAGLSTQLMGVKQTTDVLEKGTWVFSAIIAILCLTSSFFIKAGVVTEGQPVNNAGEAPIPAASAPAPLNNTQIPANAVPLNPSTK